MNIVECYMPVFKLISSVKVFPEEYGDYDSTRKQIIDTVEDVVRNSEKISLSDSELDAAFYSIVVMLDRSEERRVGKECRSRWSPYH